MNARSMKRHGKIVGILLAVGFIIWCVVRWQQARAKSSMPVYEEVAVTRQDMRLSIMATGSVQPANRLQIKPPIAGRIEQVIMREGQAVRKGQMLAQMSSMDRAALIDAALAKGPEELKHWEDLYKPTPIVAPMNGTLIARNIETGQMVATTDAVFVLSDRLIVLAQVDETDLGKIRIGQKAAIALDAFPKDSIQGVVESVAYESKTVNNVTVYEVKIAPASIPEFFRSGMTASVNFILQEAQQVLVLPVAALEKDKVLIPPTSKEAQKDNPEDTQPEHREVKLGINDGKKVEIVSGLSEGETVLIPKLLDEAPEARTEKNPFMPFGGGSKRGGFGGSRR